jgi:predicted transcriptional regulator
MKTNLERYKICDQKRLAIYNALLNEVKTQPELSTMFEMSVGTLKFHLRFLIKNGHIRAVKLKQVGNLRFYRSTIREYVPRTDKEIEQELSERMTSMSDVAHNKMRESQLPYARIIRNLDRPGSDYAWQRPKRKSVGASIGSSFSLFDGVA